MSLDWNSDVIAFHRALDQPIRKTPGFPSFNRIALRVELLREEYHETLNAIVNRDLINTADGLTDLIYVGHRWRTRIWN